MKTTLQAFLIISTFSFLLAVSVTWHVQRLSSAAQKSCRVAGLSCIRDLTELSRWQLPLSDSWHNAGTLALQHIKKVELSPDVQLRLLWDLKAALYGSRSFLRPETGTLRSRLLQDVEAEIGVAGQPDIQIQGRTNHTINYGWQALTQICFWSWIVFVVLAIFKGMRMTGAIEWQRFLPYIATALLAFAGWLFCLTAA